MEVDADSERGTPAEVPSRDDERGTSRLCVERGRASVVKQLGSDLLLDPLSAHLVRLEVALGQGLSIELGPQILVAPTQCSRAASWDPRSREAEPFPPNATS